jgi:hypothetical protein
MTLQSIAELAVLALVWLAGFCTAGALFHHQQDAAARLHAIAREVLDSGRQPRAADGRFVKRNAQ